MLTTLLLLLAGQPEVQRETIPYRLASFPGPGHLDTVKFHKVAWRVARAELRIDLAARFATGLESLGPPDAEGVASWCYATSLMFDLAEFDDPPPAPWQARVRTRERFDGALDFAGVSGNTRREVRSIVSQIELPASLFEGSPTESVVIGYAAYHTPSWTIDGTDHFLAFFAAGLGGSATLVLYPE